MYRFTLHSGTVAPHSSRAGRATRAPLRGVSHAARTPGNGTRPIGEILLPITFLIIILTLLSIPASAQERAATSPRSDAPAIVDASARATTSPAARRDAELWYFGDHAGLSFADGTAKAVTDGELSTLEGCAAVCDRASGTLRFYTDGTTVWNARHEAMPNGTGLAGCFSSAQAVVTVPDPCSRSRYYLFTTDCGSLPTYFGFGYSIVDMTRDGGLGDVIVKNVPLAPDSSTEKLTAARHGNGHDYWVLMHIWGTDEFRAYPVTADGVGAPVVSRIGHVYHREDPDAATADANWRSGVGTMKLSPDGRHLAVSVPFIYDSSYYDPGYGYYRWSSIELFDFDPWTGVLSNRIELGHSYAAQYYGVCFSPDNSKLYTASWKNSQSAFWQFDLSSGDSTTMRQSMREIRLGGTAWTGPLQLGPDGRIYVGYRHDSALGVIAKPNNPAAACDFLPRGVDLAGRTCVNGLPNFIDADMFRGVDDTIPVRVTMRVNDPRPRHGDTLRFTITVCNQDLESQTVRVSDPLPAGLTYLDGLDAYPEHSFGALGPGECRTAVLRAIVRTELPTGTPTSTCLTISPITECAYRVIVSDSDCATIQARTAVDQRTDVEVTESVDPVIVAPRRAVTYTIRIRNVAGTPARNILVRTLLPPGLRHRSYAASAPATYDDADGRLTIPLLDAGDESVLTVTCGADDMTKGVLVSRAFVAGTDPEDDNHANDTASVELTVRACPTGGLKVTGGIEGEHAISPLAPGRIPVMLDGPLDDEAITKVRITLRFDDRLLAPMSLASIDALTEGTLLRGWGLGWIRKEPGALIVQLVAPDGEYLRGAGTLLGVPFRMFLGDTLITGIGASIEFPDNTCASVEAQSGSARLDSVCGLSYRLIEIGSYKYALGQNLPNPFNPTTSIPFSIGLDGPARLEILDANGDHVTTLVDGDLAAGAYETTWDATPFGSGTYYCRLTSGGWSRTRRILVVK